MDSTAQKKALCTPLQEHLRQGVCFEMVVLQLPGAEPECAHLLGFHAPASSKQHPATMPTRRSSPMPSRLCTPARLTTSWLLPSTRCVAVFDSLIQSDASLAVTFGASASAAPLRWGPLCERREVASLLTWPHCSCARVLRRSKGTKSQPQLGYARAGKCLPGRKVDPQSCCRCPCPCAAVSNPPAGGAGDQPAGAAGAGGGAQVGGCRRTGSGTPSMWRSACTSYAGKRMSSE